MATRHSELLKLLEQHGSLPLSAISSMLHVSMSTARRDVISLEKQKLVTRSNAGVTLLNRKKHGVSLAYSIKNHEKEKRTIAQLASNLIQNKSTIFLASASATYFLIPMLAKKKDITIITNGLAHAQKAAECGLESICVGGSVSASSRSNSGMFAEYMISQLHADLCFFSVPHVSHDGKLWHYNANTVKVLQLMMNNSNRSVLLCNSQKVDDIAETYLLGNTETIDIIVSEQPLPDDLPRKTDSMMIFPET